MPWLSVNPQSEPASMVQEALTYVTIDMTDNLKKTAVQIANAYNVCEQSGLSVVAKNPNESPFFPLKYNELP